MSNSKQFAKVRARWMPPKYLLAWPLVICLIAGNATHAQQPGLSILEQLREKNVAEALETIGPVAESAETWSADDRQGLVAAGGGLFRALSQLDANERYNLLYQWTMPAEDRKSVRLFTTYVPREAPPDLFARVLRERPRETSFPISSIGGVPGLFSTGWTLVTTADELGRLNRLTAELEPLAQQQAPNADVLLMLTKLADRRGGGEELQDSLRELSLKLSQLAQSRDLNRPAIHSANVVLAAAALNHEPLKSVSVSILQEQLDKANGLNAPRLRAFLRAAHAVAVQSHLGESGPEFLQRNRLKYWIPVSNSTAALNAQGTLPAMWLTHEEHVLHLAGSRHDILLFRYPLTGDFDFTCETQEGGKDPTDGGLAYGGLAFQALGRTNQLSVWDADGEHVVLKQCPFVRHEPDRPVFNRVSIRSKGGQVHFAANLHPVWFDDRTAEQSPWLGLGSHGEHRPMFRNFKLTGHPEIPRSVSLTTGDELRGWQSHYFGETQPRFTATGSSADPAPAAVPAIVEAATDWRMTSGEIEAPPSDASEATTRQSLLRYQRPLLDGETIEYEFFFQADAIEVHPTVGRLAFLLEPGGVRIRWLTDGPLEWTGLPADNATLEPLNRRGPRPLPLQENGWNTMAISRAEERITLSLNGTPIYVRPLESDAPQKFGLYRDRSRSVRVRNAVLTGDWPEQVPQEFLDNPTQLAASKEEADNAASLHPLVGPESLAENVNGIRRRAAGLPAPERYQFLKSWVLPSPSHTDIRIAGEFVPTDPSPLARELEPHRFSSERGGELVSPVYDLLETAAELERLEELFGEVNSLPEASDSNQRRAKLALLAMIRLEQENPESAEELLAQLFDTMAPTLRNPASDYTPELNLLYRAVYRWEQYQAIGELLGVLHENRYSLGLGYLWSTHLTTLAEKSHQFREGNPLMTFEQTGKVGNWVSTSRTFSSPRGQGFPTTRWRLNRELELHLSSGNQRDYLVYRTPLSGDYVVSGELHSSGNSFMMVGGLICGPRAGQNTMAVAEFREELPDQVVDPPFLHHDEWSRFRAVVRDQQLRIFINDRLVIERRLEARSDPWIGVRSLADNAGAFRNLQVSGSPEVPEELDLSSRGAFGGWVTYYLLTEDSRNPHSMWQWSPGTDGQGEIIARRYPVGSGCWMESLLRYHRPLVEDGSIEYEFLYVPGVYHAHPALDRLVFLLQPERVGLHWMTDGKFDRTAVAPDHILFDEESQRGSGPLPLKPNAWNRMKVSLTNRTVSLTLNDRLIFEHQLPTTNLRTFGLFRYADQDLVKVRRVTMRGDWPRSAQPLEEQEFADPRLVELQTQLGELPAAFYHDFTQEGLPEQFFESRDPDLDQYVSAQAEGVHFKFQGKAGWMNLALMPNFSLSGDFDVRARFELMDDPDERWHDGLAFLEVQLEDQENHSVRSMRGREPDGRQATRAQLLWGPIGEHRKLRDDPQISWARSGCFRVARVGDRLFSLFAPEDSDDFRVMKADTTTDADVRMRGVLLELAMRDGGTGHVVWKELSLQAERMKYLPPEQKPIQKLFVMSPEGKNLRELTEPKFGFDHVGSPEFSADDSRIVMDMSHGTDSTSRIVIMNRNGSEIKNLGRGCMPSLSRDGKSIVLSEPGAGIVMMDSDGSNRRAIDRSGWGVQFSPNGNQIAYGTGSNITLMDMNTKKKRLLLEGKPAQRFSRIYWNFSWSHDSQAIAFVGLNRTTESPELVVVDFDKPDRIELLYSANGIREDVTFTPNSRSVLFALGNTGLTQSDLYLAHRTKPGQIERLEGQPDHYRILGSDWSRDGEEIVFVALVDPVPVDWPITDQSAVPQHDTIQP